jgi:hypothetical protein
MTPPEADGSNQTLAHSGVAILLAVVFGGLAALWVFWADSVLELAFLAALIFAAAFGLAYIGRRNGGVLGEVFARSNRTKDNS